MTWLRTSAANSPTCTGDGRPMTRSATRPDVELLGFQAGLRVVVVGPRMPLADELGDADTRNSDQEPERSGNYPGSHELGVLPELVD
jgi:hypothetical protein